jgi:hypothetical protein
MERWTFSHSFCNLYAFTLKPKRIAQ